MNAPWSEILTNPIVASLLRAAIDEDTSLEGSCAGSYLDADLTSSAVFSSEQQMAATLKAKESCVVCGLPIAKALFDRIDDTVRVEPTVQEGQEVEAGQELLRLIGSARPILLIERPLLNFLMRLCGIATQARRFVKLLPSQSSTILLDTRKTLPGWRLLDKMAVQTGGAVNHRLGLYDQILIKDNHIAAAGGIAQAMDKSRAFIAALGKKNIAIEIEVDNLDQFEQALLEQPSIILLDNFTDDQVIEAVRLRKKHGLDVSLEVSGGITPERLTQLATMGIDRISMGALTHSVKPIDLHLEVLQQLGRTNSENHRT